jgi:hypothetical protein
MWPRALDHLGRPTSGPKLTRRAQILALSAFAVMALATALTAWLSIHAGGDSGPVFGSAGSGPARIWTWDGTDYTLLPATGSGPYSTNADMAYDPERGIVVWDHGCSRLVMGFTGGCQSRVNQTWAWNGRGWALQSSKSEPIEVGQGVMVYDKRLRQPLYVNGVGEAWGWSGSGWRSVPMNGAPRVAPPGSPLRSTFAVGYDEGRSLLVFVVSDRTWTWDGATWTAVSGGIDYSDARLDPHTAYDTAHRQVVYVGSRFTWTWDGNSWQRHEQPNFASTTLAYDPVRSAVVLVQQDTSDCDQTSCRTATWIWDSQGWTPARVSHPALLPLTRSGAYAPPMAFDRALGVIVYFASAN